jgi:hypothetical protein
MAERPQVWTFGPASMSVIGHGWIVLIRIVGWWRPRLLISVISDDPAYKIPAEETAWIQRTVLGGKRHDEATSQGGP